MKIFCTTLVALLVITLAGSHGIDEDQGRTEVTSSQRVGGPRTWYLDYFNSIELYTFSIEVMGDCGFEGCLLEHYGYGKAFIADGQIWSARHIYDDGLDINKNGTIDIVRIGTSPLQGLEICQEKHGVGDVLALRVGAYSNKNPREDAPGVIQMTIMTANGNYWNTFMDKQIIQGDSGSPVLCVEHDKVVGLVSGLCAPYSYDSIQKVGVISRISGRPYMDLSESLREPEEEQEIVKELQLEDKNKESI
jgi:hypothetical protein